MAVREEVLPYDIDVLNPAIDEIIDHLRHRMEMTRNAEYKKT